MILLSYSESADPKVGLGLRGKTPAPPVLLHLLLLKTNCILNCFITLLVIEIASNKHTESFALLENEAKLYASEMRKIAENDNSAKNEKIIGKTFHCSYLYFGQIDSQFSFLFFK